jgi:hypothetical protein
VKSRDIARHREGIDIARLHRRRDALELARNWRRTLDDLAHQSSRNLEEIGCCF